MCSHPTARADQAPSKLSAMSNDMPDQEPEEESPGLIDDNTWFDIRKALDAAAELGVMDVSEIEDVLKSTKNEEILAKALELISGVKKNMEDVSSIYNSVESLLGAREIIAEQQYLAEAALLKRIQQLSREALPEDLHTLADTYSILRYYSVAPGTYPDNRESRADRLTADGDED
jgi:hypothetical protein